MEDADLILFAEFLGNEFAQAEDAGYLEQAARMQEVFHRVLGAAGDLDVCESMLAAYTRHGGVS
jgi:hypothetical protein